MAMRIVAVLLAAGSGSRFGGAKLLAPLPRDSHGVVAGTPIGVASALHLAAAVPEVVAVVRTGDTALTQVLRDARVRVVGCAQAHEGMGASLACGIAAARDADAWIVALADMPWCAPTTIAAVVEALQRGAQLVAPVLRGRRGHPVGFAAQFGPALLALRGDEGARTVLRDHQDGMLLIEVDDPGALGDVDRKEDLEGSREQS